MKTIKNLLFYWWINRYEISGLFIIIAMIICVLGLLEQLIQLI
jgi:hypothetical protein